MNILEIERMGLQELINQRVRETGTPSRFGRASDANSTFAPTPDEIKAKMSALNVEYNTLDASVRSQPQGRVPLAFVTSWNLQLADWRTYQVNAINILDHPLSSAGNFFTSTRTLDAQIEEYRSKLIAWNNLFRSQNPGAIPAGPNPQLPPPPPPPSSGGLPWWATSILTAAAIGGVAYLGYTAYRYVKGGASILHYATGRDASRPRMMPPFLPYVENDSPLLTECRRCGPQRFSKYDDHDDF